MTSDATMASLLWQSTYGFLIGFEAHYIRGKKGMPGTVNLGNSWLAMEMLAMAMYGNPLFFLLNEDVV